MRKLYAGITLLLMVGSAAIAAERAKTCQGNTHPVTHCTTTCRYNALTKQTVCTQRCTTSCEF